MFIRLQHLKKKDGKEYEYLQIMESYREGGKVHKKVVANLGNREMLQSQLQSLVKLLNPSLLKEEPDVKPITSAPYGGMYCVHHLFSELRLWKLLDSFTRSKRFADRVAILLANRLYGPTSEHGLAGYLDTVYSCDRAGERIVPVWKQRGRVKVDLKWLNPFYRALDVLIAHKDVIEQFLYEQLKDLFHLKVETVFYDLTSTYFEGGGPEALAKHGYSRDGRPQNKQILVGVVMANGFPLSHYIFRGNLLDHETVEDVVEDVRKRFCVGRMIWVGDRGMLTTDNVSLLKERGEGYLMGLVRRRREDIIGYIDAVRGPGVECKTGITQSEQVNAPKTTAWEVKGKEEGMRVFVVHSEERHAYERAMREMCMERVKKELEALQKRVAKGKIKKKEKIGFYAGKILSRHKGNRYYDWKINEKEAFEYFEHPVHLEREKKIEGKYLIQTEEKEFDIVEAVSRYKELSDVERGFRSLKDVLNMRPVFHRRESRVKAHIFVAALAFLLERVIERKLKSQGSNLSAQDALQALSTISVVEFDVNGTKKQGVTAGSARAREALKALGIQKIDLPEKGKCGH